MSKYVIIKNGKTVEDTERTPYASEAEAVKAAEAHAKLYYNAGNTYQVAKIVATNTPAREWC